MRKNIIHTYDIITSNVGLPSFVGKSRKFKSLSLYVRKLSNKRSKGEVCV